MTHPAQRRIVTVLFFSQVLSGAGLAAGITVGALLAQDLLGSTSLSGVPSALFTGGSALTAVLVGRLSQARGRRAGLTAGYLAGAAGSAGVITAAAVDNPVLLFASLFVYGAGTATNLQARYAGADLATPGERARAVSTVLVATTLGGVVGPNLAAPTGRVARGLGLPDLAGPFLLAGTAYVLAAVVLAVFLRPDPLLLALSEHRAAAMANPEPEPAAQTGPGVLAGAVTMVVTQLVMVAIMTMTPVHIHDHGHGTAAAGVVIAVHIAAMYLPSPLTGILVDRVGRTALATASGVTLLLAGVVAAAAPADSVVVLATALALLGLGWNFGLVAGTAMITDAVPLATRARTQGAVDVAIAVSGATGGVASGLVMSAAGYATLGLVGGALALALLPVLAASRARTP
ncbi:MFS transporter [Actinokineospora bangkokensis]|uniref:MFS transporter n=1 Tax=Actinokineospora bangkokensis TaxID=1193682 RepID=A0A1Q9LMQ0_9PSEU|nr:MFS transporter [Actinokineospora bangkokensis]OLR93291.1 MFS transporter [Actinokineospora bangkokensis]